MEDITVDKPRSKLAFIYYETIHYLMDENSPQVDAGSIEIQYAHTDVPNHEKHKEYIVDIMEKSLSESKRR